MKYTIEQQLELADDMIRCPSISEDVRRELCVLWNEAAYALDILDDRGTAALALVALGAKWAKHSTYTA